ncbi:hypothetical protein U0L90_04605 [Flavobacteriaceae sp. LMIT009]
MAKRGIKKTIILSILFFLPVLFLLFLYPSKHNYNTLDTVKGEVLELNNFVDEDEQAVKLSEQITVLAFLGAQPMSRITEAANLKELIYEKFKGFKKFQVIVILPKEAREESTLLKKELLKYDELKYWHFAFGHELDIENVFSSLISTEMLDTNYATSHVFIIDKERNQRGRKDDRTDNEIENNETVYGLNSYNCIKVAEIKNKMSEDMRILFTEYRQKRKGNFNSTSRRGEDIKGDEQN